jgi:hypothetical protein
VRNQRDADERDDRRLHALDLREQLSPAACELGAPQLGRTARRSGREVGQRVAVLREPMILERRNQLGREARGVEQPPERIARACEVMAELARACARVDPDEQDLGPVADDVRQPVQCR